MKKLAFLVLAAVAAGCNQSFSQAAATAPAAAPTAPAVAPTAAGLALGVPTAAINTPKAKQLLAQPATVVLDVRTPAEYQTGHLSQARNLDVSSYDFAQQVAKLDTAKTYVLYCRSGTRSSKAANIMYQQGFHRVVNGGGYSDLAK